MKRTCELGPEHPDTLNCLDKQLEMYEARGKWTVELLEKMVAEYPDSPDLRSRLVTDLVELGYKLERHRYATPYNAFKRAEALSRELLEVYTNHIEINPENTEAYLNRSKTYLIGLKKYDEAVLDYSAAIDLKKAGRTDEAELIF